VIHEVYRYLNLAHVCGYAGLTPVYDHDNLLVHFIQNHDLLHDDPVEKRLVMECSSKTGAKTYLRFISFALHVLGRSVDKGLISDLMAVECNTRILDMREGLSCMYQFHSQVLPYMYVHLVTLLSAVFLSLFSLEKGLLFTPDSDYVYGLLLPFLAWSIMCCSCIGLIEVGTTLANPFGSEMEDFAVYTFVEAATRNAKMSIGGELPRALQASDISPAYPRPRKFDDTAADAPVEGTVSSSVAPSTAAPAPPSPVQPVGLAMNGLGNASMITCSRRHSCASSKFGKCQAPPKR